MAMLEYTENRINAFHFVHFCFGIIFGRAYSCEQQNSYWLISQLNALTIESSLCNFIRKLKRK